MVLTAVASLGVLGATLALGLGTHMRAYAAIDADVMRPYFFSISTLPGGD